MFSKEVLDQIKIDSPCTADWDAMIGNDRVRFCSHCSLSVHHLDRITRKQALRLITRSRGRLCLRYLAGPDGRPATKSSSPLYRIMRSTSRMAAGAFGISLTVASAAATTTPNASLTATIACAEMGSDFFASGAVLSGYVYDPNGAVVTNALVALTNRSESSRRTSTDSEGRYRFEGLEAGDYSIRIEANGFAPAEVINILVRAESENVINQTLSIAPVQAEVEITSLPATRTVELGGAVAVSEPTEPLVHAAQSDDLEAVRQLLVGRPNVNLRDEHSDSTALEHAVLNANREMIQLLIWAGADVNAKDGNGRTALMLLGEKITSDAVWDLINAGAKVNARDDDGAGGMP